MSLRFKKKKNALFAAALRSWTLKPTVSSTTSDENPSLYHHPPIPKPKQTAARAVLGLRWRHFHSKQKKRTYSINNIFCWMDRQSRKSSPVSAARLRACLLLLYFLLILLYYYYYSIIINVLRLSIVDTRRHPTPPYCEEKKASWHTLTTLNYHGHEDYVRIFDHRLLLRSRVRPRFDRFGTSSGRFNFLALSCSEKENGNGVTWRLLQGLRAISEILLKIDFLRLDRVSDIVSTQWQIFFLNRIVN